MAEPSSDKSKEQTLITDLDSPKKTVRATAIVQLAKVGTDPLVIRKLQVIAESQDRELSLFAKQAISRILARVGELKVTSFNGTSLTSENLLFPLPAEIPLVLTYIRGDPQRVPEDLRPAVAEFLGKHGAASDAEYVRQWLSSSASLLALPFVEALEAISPKSLVAVLPSLLASDVPLVRVRAISALKRVDPNEAMAHLAELLGSRKAEERLAGLSISFIFPFEHVKPQLLALLRSEVDEDVIAAVELFFTSNPEEEMALRLLDMLETLPKIQVAGVSRIFKKVCAVLETAQMLPPEQAKPDAMIARWKKERLKKFLADLEVQITVCDKDRLESIEAWLKKNIQHPDVAVFAEKLSLSPATEDLYQRLTAGIVPDSPAEMNWDNPVAQPPATRRRLLESLDAKRFRSVAPWVREEAGKGIPTVRSAALLAIWRFDPTPMDGELAEEAIKSDHPKVVLAGVKLMEKLKPAGLQPFMSMLLQNKDLSVRLKAVRAALKTDAGKTIEILGQMLKSDDAPVRAQAVTCLMICPFEKVFEMLMECLLCESHPDIAQKILLILNSNPSAKVLSILDKIRGTKDPAVSILVARARAEMFELILKFGYEMFEESSDPAKIVAKYQPKAEATQTASPESGTKSKPQPSAGPRPAGPVLRGVPDEKDAAPESQAASPKIHPLYAAKGPPKKTEEKKPLETLVAQANAFFFNVAVKFGWAKPEDNQDIQLASPAPGDAPKQEGEAPVPATEQATPGGAGKPYSVSEVRNSIRQREVSSRKPA